MTRNQYHWLIFVVMLAGAALAAGGFYVALRDGENMMENSQAKQALEFEKKEGNPVVEMRTNFGVIKLELFADAAPKTVENFLKLSKAGFYDGTKFHRAIKGFMIQGGDPNSKDDDWSNDGTGGPGYTFEDEIHPDNHNAVGTISMANAGPNTNGSQFFINTANNSFLDGKHTVFGKVIEGMDAVGEIENLETNRNDHPLEDAVVESVKIIE